MGYGSIGIFLVSVDYEQNRPPVLEYGTKGIFTLFCHKSSLLDSKAKRRINCFISTVNMQWGNTGRATSS